MKMGIISGNNLSGSDTIGIHHNVQMTRTRLNFSGRLNDEVLGAPLHRHRAVYRVALVDIGEKDPCFWFVTTTATTGGQSQNE
jgi:hypothetical protein